MLSFDKKFALLRRRLIYSLRYLKLYLENANIEYTGEEIEVNVRPSLPFKPGEIAHIGVYESFGETYLSTSMPTSFKEELEAELRLMTANPLAKNFTTKVRGNYDLEAKDWCINLAKPTNVEAKRIESIGVFSGDINQLLVQSVGIDLKGGTSFSTNVKELPFTKMQWNIELPTGLGVATAVWLMIPLRLKDVDIDGAYNNDFEIGLQILRRLKEWKVDFNYGVAATPRLYKYTTMETLGGSTLSDLENMPTNVGYILLTYTSQDYPWEV